MDVDTAVLFSAEPVPAVWEWDPEADGVPGSPGSQSGECVLAGGASPGPVSGQVGPLDQEDRGWGDCFGSDVER